MRSSNGDCEETMHNFAMMSASDLFVGYMQSSTARSFFLSMLRLAEKRAKRFRNVTRNSACLLLVSRTSQENVLLVIQILTCKWISRRGFFSLYCPQSYATKICYVSIARLAMMFVEWDKRKIYEYAMYVKPLSLIVKCAHITIFGVSPGFRCYKTH